jgi:hypothetical protein
VHPQIFRHETADFTQQPRQLVATSTTNNKTKINPEPTHQTTQTCEEVVHDKTIHKLQKEKEIHPTQTNLI